MKKQLLFSLLLSFFLFSCSKKEKTNIEKKWVATVNSDYKLLTTLEDSLSYRWEGGNFEGVIHGKGKLYAYYGDSLVSTKGIEAYYGAIRQEDIISSGENKYIGSIKEKKFSGFGVWVKPNELYIGEFVENHPNGYLIYYKDGKRSYIGMWEHGKRTGRGTNYGEDGKIVSGIWKDNAIFELDTTLTTEKGIFKGLLRNSFPQGYGEMNYFSGSQYKGDWNNGKMEGEGIFTTATDTLIGEWKDGKLNGYGLCKTPSFLFEGDLKDNKPEGMGYIFFTDSTFYSGGWANGKMNGYGDITLSNGDTYMGNWKDDQYHGGGCYTYHTGETYDGYWKEGLQDSLGTYTCKDYTYKGQWEEGWINGQGKITYSNGDYYEGDFVENQKYGIGYYHFNNGNAYDGEFVDNKFNGLGIFTFKNGSRYQGEFRDGKIKGDGTLFLKEGKETIAITANWDGSTKFPKAASVLFENGDLYEGELDSAGFPTKNGVWTSAEDREKGITSLDKANEFYKRHKDTWKNIVSYTTLALEVTAAAAMTTIAITAIVATAPVSVPALITTTVVAGTGVAAINGIDMGITYKHSEIEIEKANGDKEKIAQIKKQRNEELLESGINVASGVATIVTAGAAGAASSIAKTGLKQGAKQLSKQGLKQGLKLAGENMAKNIDPQDIVDMAEAVIKKDKKGMLMTAGIIAAGAIMDIKLPKTSPIRKATIKLSTAAKQVSRTAMHFTRNKVFGKIVKLVKNSSGVIEKQWIRATDIVWNTELGTKAKRILANMQKISQYVPNNRYNRLSPDIINKQKLGFEGDSKILRENGLLGLTSAEKENLKNEERLSRKMGRKSNQAHHVIPGTSSSEAAKEARQILNQCGVDINDMRNCIFLPMHPKSILVGSLHGKHTNQYEEDIKNRLLEAKKKGGCDAVMEALDMIKLEITKGKIALLSEQKHSVNTIPFKKY